MGAPESDKPREVLKEILTRQWHRPVLQALSQGPQRYVDIRTRLLAVHDPAPGEGQVNNTLRDLAELKLVEKSDTTVRAPWTLTASGRTALAELDYLDRLLSSDPAEAHRGTAGAASADGPAAADRATPRDGRRRDQSRRDLAARVAALNPAVPHPARRYDYWLGGKDNFEADRRSADEFERLFPGMRAGVRANRDVLRRMVRFLAAEAGVRQFLDIGTGLPTADNTHEVAQAVAPSSRVVYVDNDPLVLTHARALLTSAPQGRTAYIEADLREPDNILKSPEVHDTFDLDQPIALLLIAVLHFIPGEGVIQPIVSRLVDALPPGSYLAVTHLTQDFLPPAAVANHEQMQRSGRSDFWMRHKDEVDSLFHGLQILQPGIVPTTRWRPDPDTPDPDLHTVNTWAAVGRKPSAQ